MTAWTRLRRWLRAPRLIIAELALVALAAAAMTAVPQVPEQSGRPPSEPSAWMRAAAAMDLDHVLASWWFLSLLALSALSLTIVTWDQWRTARALWRERLSPAHFRSAPFRREWTRTTSGAQTQIETRGRVSLLGSPLFHSGLLLIFAAGLVRMLFGVEAVVDLYEGEVLPPAPTAFGAQWPGRLAEPFALDRPLALERISAETYPSGGLERLSADLRFQGDAEPVALAVNAPLRQGLSTSLYLTQTLGPAALLQAVGPRGHEPVAVLLQPDSPTGTFAATTTVGDLEVRLRGEWRPGAPPPEKLQCRVLRDRALVFAGLIGRGSEVQVPGGGTLTLVESRQWARFTAQRDPSVPLIYLGFLLGLVGTALMFGTVKVDTAVVVEPGPEGEKVLVALRARRFAVLFDERFERLVRTMGGPEKPAS
ncbi:MAG: cytochrome c biogenesis protein ResB [Myxococcales bacterium]